MNFFYYELKSKGGLESVNFFYNKVKYSKFFFFWGGGGGGGGSK